MWNTHTNKKKTGNYNWYIEREKNIIIIYAVSIGDMTSTRKTKI